MTRTTFAIDADIVNNIADCEATINKLNGKIKGDKLVIEGNKMSQYSSLLYTVKDVKLQKGNFPKTVRNTIVDMLKEQAKVSTATNKRLLENTAAGLKWFRDNVEVADTSNWTPSYIMEELARLEVDTENALKKACNPNANAPQEDVLAEKVVGKWSTKKDENGNKVQGDKFVEGLTDEQLDRFYDKVTELMAARTEARNTAAAKEAEKSVKDENVAVNEADAIIAGAA